MIVVKGQHTLTAAKSILAFVEKTGPTDLSYDLMRFPKVVETPLYAILTLWRKFEVQLSGDHYTYETRLCSSISTSMANQLYHCMMQTNEP